MFNPIEEYQKFRNRIGKPIRPIVELQKNGSIVNIVTNTIQDGNIIQNTYQSEVYELHPDDKASAIYIDGIFKGMGFFAGDEGQILRIQKDVDLFEEVHDKDGNIEYDDEGKPKLRQVVIASYKGIFGKLVDANLIERGSALKMSLGGVIVYCLLVFVIGWFLGSTWR